MTRLTKGFLVFALASCGLWRGGGPGGAGAEAAVRELFDASAAGDCARIRPLLPKLATEEACHEYVGDVKEHDLRLLGVNRVVVDARDPAAWIVRAQVTRGGTEKEMLVRAEWTGDAWIVVF